MSAGNPAGAVTVPFVADLSAVYAALTELRRQGPVPINFSAGGPASGAGAATGPTGAPATFGNPGGIFLPPAAGIGGSFTAGGPGGGFSPAQAAGGGSLGQVTQGLNQAAQSLQQAAQTLLQAVQSGGSGGSPASGGGQATGPAGSGAFNSRGFARYVAGAFLAREAASLIGAGRDYSIGEDAAAGRPEQRLANERRLINRVGGVPLLGPLASLLADPTGEMRARIDLTEASAASGVEFSMMQGGYRSQAYLANRSADNSGLLGARRQLAEAETSVAANKIRIQAERTNPARLKLLDEIDAQDREKFEYDAKFQGPGAAGELHTAEREKSRDAMNAAISRRRSRADDSFSQMMAAEDKRLAFAKTEAVREETRAGFDYQSTGSRYYEMSSGTGPSRSALYEIDKERIGRHANYLRKGAVDPAVGDRYEEAEMQRLDYENQQQDRQEDTRRRGVRAQTLEIKLRSGNTRETQGQSPAIRNIYAHLQHIVDETDEDQRREIMQSHKNPADLESAVREIAERGQAQVAAMRQQYLESGHAVAASNLGQIGFSSAGGMEWQLNRRFADARLQSGNQKTDLGDSKDRVNISSRGGDQSGDPNTAKSAATLEQLNATLLRIESKLPPTA